MGAGGGSGQEGKEHKEGREQTGGSSRAVEAVSGLGGQGQFGCQFHKEIVLVSNFYNSTSDSVFVTRPNGRGGSGTEMRKIKEFLCFVFSVGQEARLRVMGCGVVASLFSMEFMVGLSFCWSAEPTLDGPPRAGENVSASVVIPAAESR